MDALLGTSPPDGGFDEYVENEDGSLTWVSDLGRNEGLDFRHLRDGTTRIDEFQGGEIAVMGKPFSGQVNQMMGFDLRDSRISREDLFSEFANGTGSENSLFYGRSPRGSVINHYISNSYVANEARGAFLNGDGGKVGGGISFGLFGAIRSGSNMHDQFLKKAKFSVYPITNDRVLIMINDSKTFNSINPLAKFGDWLMGVPEASNYSRSKSNNASFSSTRQTYIWIESIHILKQKHSMYGN